MGEGQGTRTKKSVANHISLRELLFNPAEVPQDWPFHLYFRGNRKTDSPNEVVYGTTLQNIVGKGRP